MVSENGLATEDDTQGVEFLQAAVDCVASCLADDIDVRGYIAWTAFDNFKWIFGYRPKFGLIAVDRSTQERTPKEVRDGWEALRGSMSGSRWRSPPRK